MSRETYVSYETAKLLKEKGFNCEVFHFYDENGHLMHREGDCYFLYNWNYPTKDEYGSQYCSAPTQQMACRWLEETYGLFIKIGRSMDINSNYYYRYDVLDKDNTGQMKSIRPSKEDAIEAALQYVLTKLI